MAEELKTQQPDYIGHRARLRERFLMDDGVSMPDYELLELLLSYAIPRRDVKPIAKKLMKTFGSLGRVLHASTEDLRTKGKLTDNVITLFHLFISFNLRISSMQFADSGKPVILVWQNFIDYCINQIGYKEIEESWVFFFNSRMEFIKGMQLSSGTMNQSPVNVAKIIHEAIKKNAVNVVLAHNHPSGICKPSRDDIAVTQYIVENLAVAGLIVFDHIVVTTHQYFSFRENGYIKTDKK